MGIFDKTKRAVEAKLDSTIAKSEEASMQHQDTDRKAYTDIDGITGNTGGVYRERYSMAGPQVLKNMARKDSLVIAIHQALVNQVVNFTQVQRDRYSPGFKIKAKEPADLTREEKMELANPDLSEEEFNQKKYELEQKRMKLQLQQEKDIEEIQNFLLHCGGENTETDTTYKRIDFTKLIKLLTRDRLTYNYVAIELIPTNDGSKIHNFYPVSAGSIRYVSAKSAKHYNQNIKPALAEMLGGKYEKQETDEKKPFRYVQVIRGKPVAAFTEDELIFEPANPTVDPEDYGYGQGELEWLVTIITSHLYAEAHNRNFFTQGVGNKGILHIKGDNISRAQLEGFKRQWFNQLSNSRNSFRPPVIGMADDVKWIPLTQSNREMEFQQWMEYLIKISCAIYQIDPSEINFDISKNNTSTLNEANNEQRVKSSKTKGLRPLLMYLQDVINHNILPRWNKDLSEKYEFVFAGLDAETRQEEVDRLEKESQVYKTVNEIRTEQGFGPIDYGDVILNAAYTQYIQMQEQQEQMEQGAEGGDEAAQGGDEPDEQDQDYQDLEQELDTALGELDDEPESKAEAKVQKSQPTKIEYYNFEGDDDE